jgi:cytochrome c
MDSFELNKILGAVLGTCLFLLALNIAAGALYSAPKPAKPGYDIAAQEQTPEESQGVAPAAAAEPIEKLLANASLERGESSAKKCAACHTFGKGEPNKVGPNQWGVVGRPKASVPGFNYSAAMKAKGGNWTIDELNAFIANPKAAVPGTAMTFAGVPRASERADIITYLNSRSDNPAPLPVAAQSGSGGGQAAPAAPQPH